MRRYLLKRLVVAIPSLVIASLIIFTLPRLLPGDAVQLMLEEKAYGKDVDDLRHKLGLDRPMYIQYFAWLGQIGGRPRRVPDQAHGDRGAPHAAPVTPRGMAACFSVIIGIPSASFPRSSGYAA
jgi:peptide/nickel transport system permease protein